MFPPFIVGVLLGVFLCLLVLWLLAESPYSDDEGW